MKKRLLTILLSAGAALACGLGLAACNGTNGGAGGQEEVGTPGLHYQRISGQDAYRVIGLGLAAEVDIVIPDTYNGLPVTAIAKGSFSGQTYIKSVVIPDSVTSIGDSAFANCTSLAEMTLPFVGETKDGEFNTHFGYIFGASDYSYNDDYVPTSLKKVTITGGDVGNDAFSGCGGLKSIVILGTMTSIGEDAFYNCDSLTSIVVDERNKTFKSIDGNLYSQGGKQLMQYAIGKAATSFIVPDAVTSIGANAFKNSDLTSIVIPDSVTTIGEAAFAYCDSLTEIIIPDSVTRIGTGAFDSCKSLTEIVIPDSVTSIGDYAFSRCASLTNVTFGENSRLITIGQSMFSYCSSLTSVAIPDGVEVIEVAAFRDCSSLTDIVIPNSVTIINSYAFYYCANLTKVVIPDSVAYIDHTAFAYCDNLTIYCEAESKPSGWYYTWNYSNRPVVWGYKGN